MPTPKRPKLGQHFLRDLSVRKRIVQTLGACASDLVIEIGPGRGELTELVAGCARRVVAIELDDALASRLQTKFANEPRVEIIQGDVLAADLGKICLEHHETKCLVLGNLPYYISSPILRHLFGFRQWIRAATLLLQHEVAARLTAEPGSRDYGYLSVLAQLHSAPSIAFDVPRGAFRPAPKVQSAVVRMEMASHFPQWTGTDHERFHKFIQLAFRHKRKTLTNSLGCAYLRKAIAGKLQGLRLRASVRAEQLSVDELARLWAELERCSRLPLR